MKILWYSTAPFSPSSYSILTNRTVPNLVLDGHQVALGTWYGLQGNPLPWTILGKDKKPVGAVTIFPSGDGPAFSQDVLLPLYNYIEAEALIVCSDIWPFETQITGQTLFCPWFPVDMDPLPEPVEKALETAAYPMVYSRWGKSVCAAAGVETHYIPAGVDSLKFKPTSQPKKELRQTLGMPADKIDFLVAVVAANKDPHDRKGFAETLPAFARFAQSHPDAYMYLHTNWDGAIKIKPMVDDLGIQNRVIQPDPFGYRMGLLDENYMVNVYRAADVLLNLAKSEGFGLPLVEAQMCGTPIVASDFSTTDEMLFAGWKVGGQPEWAMGLNSWRLSCSISQAVDALEEAYKERGNKTLQLQARRGIRKEFDNDAVFAKYWRPALATIETIATGGKGVYDFAKSFDGQIPTQPFGGAADRVVPRMEKEATA